MTTVETVSAEAIRYQGQSPLFKELTAAIEKKLDYVKDYKTATAANVPMDDVEHIIKTHTGLPMKVIVEPSNENHLGVTFPPIDMKNPLFISLRSILNDAKVGFFYQQLAMKKAKMVSGEFLSLIDLDAGKVSGAFEDFQSELYLPFRMFNGKMTAEELAAGILHELGHVFTYLENLFGTTSTNITLLNAWYEYSDTQDSKQKIKILDELFAELKIKNMRPENIDLMKSKEEFITVIATGRMQEIRSALGSSSYDSRNSEIAADQFAVRHGAAIPLLTALDKIHRIYGLEDYSEKSSVYVTGITVLSFTTLFLLFFPWLGWAALTTFFVIFLAAPDNLDQKRYDDPAQRIDRAIHDLIQVSKRMKQNSKQAFKLSDDIQALTHMRSVVKDNESLFFLIWRNIKSSRRDQHAQQVFQRQLEELVNNRLYAHSILLNKLANQ